MRRHLKSYEKGIQVFAITYTVFASNAEHNGTKRDTCDAVSGCYHLVINETTSDKF